MGLATTWRFGDQEDERTHVDGEKHPLSNCTNKKKVVQSKEMIPKCLWKSMKFYNMIPNWISHFWKIAVSWYFCPCKSYWIWMSRGNVIVYSAAIGACEEGRQWQQVALPRREWWLMVLDQHARWMNLEFGEICCVELSTAWSSIVMRGSANTLDTLNTRSSPPG